MSSCNELIGNRKFGIQRVHLEDHMDSNRKPSKVAGNAGSAVVCPLPSAMLARHGRFAAGVFALLLALTASPALHAQNFDAGGTGALGNFINPLLVTSSIGEICNYDLIRIDLEQGKVFARPFRQAGNASCNATLVDITNAVDTGGTGQKPFAIAPTGPFTDGVIEVTNFTLQQHTTPSGAAAASTVLDFVPGVDNYPPVIRATGDVTINANTTLSVAGRNGGDVLSTFLRGAGGLGGPGGYRGGDGGNAGLSPSAGSPGSGPGGGPAGAIGSNAIIGAKFLTTGTTVGGTVIPTGNDLVTILRGGSGGGGGGGAAGQAGGGAGGGGGAILIASNGTITVNGTITANGGFGADVCCSGGGEGSGGTGGIVRLVSPTIAGGGALRADRGGTFNCRFNPCAGTAPAPSQGIVRLEAFTISYNGTLAGGVAATSAPGQIVLPSAPTVFLKFASITDSSNGANTVTVPPLTQAIPGRTGNISSVDVTMPNPGGVSANTVTVALTAGPNTGTTSGFPGGKTVTLVVTPLDPTLGASQNYSAAITCPAPTAPCTATVPGVTLPLGFSSMSAFTVVNLNSSGALARLFPKTFENETIESVRIQTDGKDTEYVLIAESGREFAYKPGAANEPSVARGNANLPR